MVLRARRRVIVHLKSGESIEGILMRKRPEVIVEYADKLLTEAEKQALHNATGDNDEKVQIQGRVAVFRENVNFIQVLR